MFFLGIEISFGYHQKNNKRLEKRSEKVVKPFERIEKQIHQYLSEQ